MSDSDLSTLMRAETADPPASTVDLTHVMRAGRRCRRWRVVRSAAGAGVTLMAIAVGAVVFTTGPGTTPFPPVVVSPPVTVSPPAVAKAAADPAALVGMWTVNGRTGQSRPVRLRLDWMQLVLVHDCGTMSGQWRADPRGMFVADAQAAEFGSESCWKQARRGDLTPDWLAAVTAFRIVSGRPVLLDARGRVVVRLTARPFSELQDRPPGNLDGSRAAFRRANPTPAPLPAGLVPATPASLVGRWLSVRTDLPERRKPSLELGQDHRWHADDGCNDIYGRWIAGPDGLVMATGALTTTPVGCVGDGTPLSFSGVARAGYAGDILVMLATNGIELGRLRRASG